MTKKRNILIGAVVIAVLATPIGFASTKGNTDEQISADFKSAREARAERVSRSSESRVRVNFYKNAVSEIEAAKLAEQRRIAAEQKRRADARAAKSAAKKKAEGNRVANKTQPLKKAPAVSSIQARIRWCESHDNYKAQNNHSSASGAYQFLDSSWHSVTGLSGSAKDYSKATQDAAFVKLYRSAGTRPWNASRSCWS
jgi:predicted outer membrane protein